MLYIRHLLWINPEAIPFSDSLPWTWSLPRLSAAGRCSHRGRQPRRHHPTGRRRRPPEPPPPTGAAGPARPVRASLAADFGRAPLPFEQNLGQTDPSVRFMTRGPGFGLWLTGDRAVFSVARPAQEGQGSARDLSHISSGGPPVGPG